MILQMLTALNARRNPKLQIAAMQFAILERSAMTVD
jgi:hypothetical protein